jgi:hypothetical protein
MIDRRRRMIACGARRERHTLEEGGARAGEKGEMKFFMS